MYTVGATLSDNQRGCYAVKVRSRGESAVGRSLRQKGFDIILPTYIQRRHYSDRIKEVSHALFPGYVFVRMDPKEVLPIISTEGVSYIVRSGKALHPLPQEEVAAIESLCNVREGCEPCVNFNVGQRISIESGPLQGLQGILARVGDNDRIVVCINSIFSSVSVDVRNTVIKKIA